MNSRLSITGWRGTAMRWPRSRIASRTEIHVAGAAQSDILGAIAFLKAHAAALGIDATRLVLLGRSAGQSRRSDGLHRAGSGDPGRRGVVCAGRHEFLLCVGTGGRRVEVSRTPAPVSGRHTRSHARAAYEGRVAILHVSKSTPPTLLFTGYSTRWCGTARRRRLDQRLAETGVAHAFVSLPWATHGIDYNLSGPGGQLTTFAVRMVSRRGNEMTGDIK